MELIKKNIEIIVISAVELIIGILLLINPADFTRGLIMVIGTLLLIRAVLFVIAYIKAKITALNTNQDLFAGLLFLAGGLFCILNTQWFVDTFPALTILFGLSALVVGLEKVQWAADRARLHNPKWFLKALCALYAIIVGIITLINPFTDISGNWLFTGIAFIIMAVIDIAVIFFENAKPKAPQPVEEVKPVSPEPQQSENDAPAAE